MSVAVSEASMIAAPKAANGAAVKQCQLVGSILAATFSE
ncbi:hypothetical protein Lpp17_0983 [Lacticaseibacillus paracasei subsp. paracasei Lpp17]|nr:hypothetical protein Lpp17_0983 [Lacticaseibacillus paracasei subsp. paracasei Lpp17]